MIVATQWKFATNPMITDPINAAVTMYSAARASLLSVNDWNIASPSNGVFDDGKQRRIIHCVLPTASHQLTQSSTL
jgi:hypothetical protein